MRQITLNKRQEEFIAAELAQGKFSHPDEVVNAAFKLLEKLQMEYQDWLTETRAKVQSAALEMERGEGLEGETFHSQTRAIARGDFDSFDDLPWN